MHESVLLYMNSQNEHDMATRSFYNFHIKNTNKFVTSDIMLSNKVKVKKGL